MKSLNIAPKGFRILVVEDDDKIRKYYADVLRIFGFKHVTLSEDGADALERISNSNFPYDLIIVDWEMPVFNGLDVVKHLRKSPDSPNYFTPILMATGKGQLRHVQEARDMGINEFLVKPFDIEQLKSKLYAICHNPRDFIVCDHFVGPCRRRKSIALPEGRQDRRNAA